jgi:hypothetical protein
MSLAAPEFVAHILPGRLCCPALCVRVQLNLRDHPRADDVSSADHNCQLRNDMPAQPAVAPSAQPDGGLAVQPDVQMEDADTASRSSSCAPLPELLDSHDVTLPLNLFKHLTGLDNLRELQECCLAGQLS